MYRHEKIVLVVLSYVIGFTTAYIGFGITPDGKYDADYKSQYKHEPQLPAPRERDTTSSENTSSETDVDVILTDEGMFATINNREVIISGKLRESVSTGPGFHVDIPRYETSPDGEYVYYCEQQSEEENICHEYIYLVQKHLIKPLKAQGQTLTSSVSDAGFRWQREGVLTSPEYVSMTPEAPWEMISME